MTNSQRIQTICSFVDKSVVAEIGADHGYITKLLFEQNKIQNAYLTDISAKCLQKAIDGYKNKSYFNKTKFLVGDGLEALQQKNCILNENAFSDKNIEQIIIAGMGGNEIIKILSNLTYNKYSNFVLQPQRNVVELRKFLQDNNYLIEFDTITSEGKLFYNVIKAKKSNKKVVLTDDQIIFGKTNLTESNEHFIKYVNYELSKLQEIFEKGNKSEQIKQLIKKFTQMAKINKGE